MGHGGNVVVNDVFGLWVTAMAKIWWWLRFCDGGGRGRWQGFVIVMKVVL